jgi:hypothetical protein
MLGGKAQLKQIYPVAIKLRGKNTRSVDIKATIRREGMNYTISNVGGTFLADVGTHLDMLRWTPGLVVDDENDIKTGDNKCVGEFYID